MKFTYDDLRDYLNRVSRLYALTSNLLDYYNNVIKQVNGKSVDELPEDLKNMVLSGLKPDGEYTENAYALFIKDLVGLYIEDPKLYVSRLKLGTETNVKVVVEETQFVEFVQLLNTISKFVVSKATELNLIDSSAIANEDGAKQQSIEDLITELIKTLYDLSVGVHNFSTGVWGLRKITPHYMKKAYEDLPENLLKLLGFSKLIDVKGYELWGFPDYFTRCALHKRYEVTTGPPYFEYYKYHVFINGVPAVLKQLKGAQLTNFLKPETPGGAICMLNEVTWRYISLLHQTLSKWYEGVIDVEKRYVEEAWRSLNDIGWDIPKYLEGLYVRLEEVLLRDTQDTPRFLIYDEYGVISKYIWYCGYYEIIIWGRRLPPHHLKEQKLQHYILLPELFDDLMPAMFLGVVDVTLCLDSEKALLIVVRARR